MCLECSGTHRSLGVHISFIQSVTMDSWKNARFVAKMDAGGNADFNDFLERQGVPPKVIKGPPGTTDPQRLREKYHAKACELYMEKMNAAADGKGWNEPAYAPRSPPAAPKHRQLLPPHCQRRILPRARAAVHRSELPMASRDLIYHGSLLHNHRPQPYENLAPAAPSGGGGGNGGNGGGGAFAMGGGGGAFAGGSGGGNRGMGGKMEGMGSGGPATSTEDEAW